MCKPDPETFAPQITMWTDLRLERPEATVQLFCRARANPPAEITWWSEAEDDPSRSELLIENDGTHVVKRKSFYSY